MKLYVATHNQHKMREIAQILPGFEIVADDPEGVVEDAPDFVGNAFIKVRAVAARHPGEWCMADDSGLEVRALGGAPGVRSARYAGEPADTPANNALLLKNMEGVADRTANFTCAIALVDPEGRELSAVGKCFGRIAKEPSGAKGFGYDPLFVPDGYDKSFADLTADEKNAISHRGRALSEAERIMRPKRRGGVMSWLRLFRAVNLPTVPGDVFVGAAAALTAGGLAGAPHLSLGWSARFLAPVWWAAGASVFVYMFGLVHNDIAGAKTDRDRPLADGEISMDAAWAAAAACLGAALACLYFGGHLGGDWWSQGATPPNKALLSGYAALLVAVVSYNRWKNWWMMGLCRALNVLVGATAAGVVNARAFAAATVWWLYISLVTLYSEGEDRDPAKKKAVGFLVGAVVYLQLLALVALALSRPDVAGIRALLAGGAVMLAALRLAKSVMPRVSAS